MKKKLFSMAACAGTEDFEVQQLSFRTNSQRKCTLWTRPFPGGILIKETEK